MRRKSLLLAIFLVWLSGVAIYGWIDVSMTMDDLRVNPAPDLYANDLGFQIIVFAITKGMASLFVLGIWLFGVFLTTGRTKRDD